MLQQMKVHRHRIVARFGLMHMIGTNLSVWLNVLVQETKHEILTFYNPENNSLRISHRLGKRKTRCLPCLLCLFATLFVHLISVCLFWFGWRSAYN